MSIPIFALNDSTDTKITIGILNSTINGNSSYSTSLLNNLKTYAPTLKIDTDDERVYMNLLPLQQKLNSAYKDFKSTLNTTNQNTIIEKKDLFESAEKNLFNTSEYFKFSNELVEPIDDIIIAPNELYLNSFMFDEDVPITYATFSPSKFDPKALLEESSVVARIVARENNYDILILPEFSSISTTLSRLRLKVYNAITDKFETLFDEIVTSFDIEEKLETWVLTLSKYISDRNYVMFTVAPKDYSISVTVDKKHLTTEKGIVLEGEHTVEFSSPGRITKRETIDFKKGPLNTLDIDLEKHHYENLTISTNSNKGNIEADGRVFSMPHTFESFETPFDYTLNEVGFLPYTNAITRGKDDMKLNISMRPEWTDDTALLHNTEVKFYSMITATLGLFTASVIARSFMNTGTNQAIYSSISDITSGAAYASIGFILGFLVDYFLISKYNLY